MLPVQLDRLYQILSVLADGCLHSGVRLAQRIGVSRTTIWRSINTLRSYNLDIVMVNGRGYRLPRPYDILDPVKIRRLLTDSNTDLSMKLEFFPVLDSTNAYLLNRIDSRIHRHIVLAEYQTHGRGRRGRYWISPFGCGLNISIGMIIRSSLLRLSCLSVAIGIGVIRALKQHVKAPFQLKWPNDVMFDARKLGGILLEVRSSGGEHSYLVIGIGLNIRFPAKVRATIQQPWIDLASITDHPPPRNQLAASLIKQIDLLFTDDISSSAAHICKEWRQYDFCYGKQVELGLRDRKVYGVARGVDDQGRFLLMVAGVMRRFDLGEVTVRVQQ